MTDAAPYHRLATRRWLVVAEVALALLFTMIGMVVLFAIVLGATGVRTTEELDDVSAFVVTFLGLALLLPSTRWAARICKRDPGTLSSVAGRLRGRWLLRCVWIVLGMHAVITLPWIIAAITGAHDDFVWRGWDRVLPMLSVIVLCVPLQAAGEEYFFRGTLLQSVGAWVKSPWLPIAISSAAFAAIHLAPLEATIALFAMGLIDAYLTVRTGGLEAAIAAHVSNNVVLLATMTVSGDTTDITQVNTEVGWSSVILQTGVHVVYAFVVLRQYRKRFAPALTQGSPAGADQV